MFGLGDIYISLEEAGDSSVEPVQPVQDQESDPNTQPHLVPGRSVVSIPCVTAYIYLAVTMALGDKALEEVSDCSLTPKLPVQESDPNTSDNAPGRSVVSYIHPCVTAYI